MKRKKDYGEVFSVRLSGENGDEARVLDCLYRYLAVVDQQGRALIDNKYSCFEVDDSVIGHSPREDRLLPSPHRDDRITRAARRAAELWITEHEKKGTAE